MNLNDLIYNEECLNYFDLFYICTTNQKPYEYCIKLFNVPKLKISKIILTPSNDDNDIPYLEIDDENKMEIKTLDELNEILTKIESFYRCSFTAIYSNFIEVNIVIQPKEDWIIIRTCFADNYDHYSVAPNILRDLKKEIN